MLVWMLPAALLAQAPEARLDPRSSFQVNLPAGSPVALKSADWAPSTAAMRGGALQLDLHSTLLLTNTSGRRINGISFLVLAQEVTPGGKASVTVPSLDVGPEETFPVKIDLRLMRPPAPAQGALVEVSLDGVLFEDLTFFGPNRLNSRRAMTAWELEARRDRKYLLALLESGGGAALQAEMTATLNRLAAQPRLEIQSARSGRATIAVGSEQQIEFALLDLPGAPVELTGGLVRVAGNQARLPRLELQNRSRRTVRSLEIGWLLKDEAGREYHAGALPAEVGLKAGEKTEFTKDAALKFFRAGGAPVSIASLTAYVAQVEFAEGDQWVPPHAGAALAGRLPVPAELERLAGIYRKRGLAAVEQIVRRGR